MRLALSLLMTTTLAACTTPTSHPAKPAAPKAPPQGKPAMTLSPAAGLVCADETYRLGMAMVGKKRQATLESVKGAWPIRKLELCEMTNDDAGDEVVACQAATDEHAFTVRFSRAGFTGQVYGRVFEGQREHTSDLGIPCQLKRLEDVPGITPSRAKGSRCGPAIPPELCDPP